MRKSVVASINTAQGSTELQLARLGSQVRAGRTGIDAFFTMPVVPGSPPPTLGRVLNLRVALPEQPNVVAVPMQAIYDNTRVYVIVEDRLVERQIERVGETSAVDGDYKVLVRSTDLRRGDVLLTSQLPSAVSGMLVTTLGTEAMEQVAQEAVDIPVEEIAEDIAEEGEEVAPASSTGSAASSDVPGVALAVAP